MLQLRFEDSTSLIIRSAVSSSMINFLSKNEPRSFHPFCVVPAFKELEQIGMLFYWGQRPLLSIV